MTNDMSQLVQLVDYVRKFQKPNVYGARIPLHTAWNVHLMQQLAESTSDREVVQFIIFGWSLNHNGAPVTISTFNHPSADRHPDVMNDYIRKEFAHGCLLGPFVTPPWTGAVAVSPMSTRPKKDPGKRRVIMDLSWPHNGRSVNDGIPKDRYLEQVIDLQYPTIDTLCKRAAKVGPRAMGYKIDMDRAFKQIIMDMADWPLLGITWMKMLYFDKTAVMGSRSASYICQRVTNFIRHIMVNLQYFVTNYVDNFMGLDSMERILQSFHTLRNLLRDLGASEALQKAVEPTHIIEFLGVLFDLLRMTISVSPSRVQELEQELQDWQHRTTYTRKQLDFLTREITVHFKLCTSGSTASVQTEAGLEGEPTRQEWYYRKYVKRH